MGRVTSLFVRKMVAAAAPEIDGRAALTSVGLDPDAPAAPQDMISDLAYYDLLERMADEADVTGLPIRTGASMRCDDYGALGLAFKAAPTLGGSYARVARYARLWTSVVEYELVPQDDATTLFLLHRQGERRLGLRLSNEATLASAVQIAREVSPAGFTPLEVRVRHAAPKTLAHHRQFFGCPVVFDARMDGLLISNAVLERSNKLGDDGITRFLIGHLDAELKQLADEPSLAEQAQDAIARSLSEGVPKMADVARRLGLSVRSLHRRLSDDGLTFKTLTERTRQDLAEGLLADERYSLSEVAFLTGFSEQSSFTRAFKKWVGHTPAHFRRAQIGG